MNLQKNVAEKSYYIPIKEGRSFSLPFSRAIKIARMARKYYKSVNRMSLFFHFLRYADYDLESASDDAVVYYGLQSEQRISASLT